MFPNVCNAGHWGFLDTGGPACPHEGITRCLLRGVPVCHLVLRGPVLRQQGRAAVRAVNVLVGRRRGPLKVVVVVDGIHRTGLVVIVQVVSNQVATVLHTVAQAFYSSSALWGSTDICRQGMVTLDSIDGGFCRANSPCRNVLIYNGCLLPASLHLCLYFYKSLILRSSSLHRRSIISQSARPML